MSSGPNHLSLAIQHLRAGRPLDAEAAVRQHMLPNPDDPEALHLLGIIAGQTNRPAEALRLFDTAIEYGGDVATYHNSRGSLLYQLGRFAEAESSFRRAVEMVPDHADPHNNLGNALRGLGRLEEAEVCFRRALELRSNSAEIVNNLGATLRDLGRVDEAEACFRRVLELVPDALDGVYNLGDALYDQMQLDEAETCFRRVIAGAPHFVPAYVGLGHVLQSQSRLDEAIEVLNQGLERAPGHPMLAFALRLVHSSAIPGWHLPMINDHERNDAYQKALERAVTPESVVLEIGTGSALVAMMAARAGAKHVYTCEVNRPLARVARETVTVNGYAERITVIPKMSTELKVGADLPERADVFVSELINIGMLAPNMLHILQHARSVLVKPGAKIIPAAATVYGMLLQCDELARLYPLRSVSGFDMSRFDIFRTPGYVQIDLAADEHRELSRPFTALEFDFRRTMRESDRFEVTVEATAPGLCHGVAFWFDLIMHEDVVYSSASRARTNHWKQAMHFFDEPLAVQPGDVLKLAACYDNNRIYFERR